MCVNAAVLKAAPASTEPIPPIHKGRRGRPKRTSNQSAEPMVAVAPRNMATPKPNSAADTASNWETTQPPAMKGNNA